MTITLYNFDKRENSTKQPQAGLDFDNAVLKEPTDFLNPVIRFTAAGLGGPTIAPISYNYARIPKFMRYYFIRNWEYIGGCWEASLSVDVLGTWKTVIGGMNCYIDRAQSEYDSNVIDTFYPAKTNFQIGNTPIQTAWTNVSFSSGCFVLGVVNDNNGTGRLGAISYYCMDNSQLGSLLAFLFSNNIWLASNVTEIGQGLYKSLFNPFQYIISCMWFPISASVLGSTTVNVKVGYWDTGLQARAMSLVVANPMTFSVAMPAHPQAASRGNFLNYAPYTSHMLYIPPFGSIQIPPEARSRGTTLTGSNLVDIITGQATLRIDVSDSSNIHATVAERSCMFGVPIQLAQILSDYSQSISMLTHPSGMSLAGMAVSAAGAVVMSAIEAQTPKVSVSGANGALFNFITMTAVLESEFTLLSDENISQYGRPLLQNRTINTLSGYVKCGKVNVQIPCLLSEKTMIEQYLTEGFYYE